MPSPQQLIPSNGDLPQAFCVSLFNTWFVTEVEAENKSCPNCTRHESCLKFLHHPRTLLISGL
jgi:hypothetical protein